jgi:hypothetical protein
MQPEDSSSAALPVTEFSQAQVYEALAGRSQYSRDPRAHRPELYPLLRVFARERVSV